MVLFITSRQGLDNEIADDFVAALLEDVSKHADHDQSTHGSWADGLTRNTGADRQLPGQQRLMGVGGNRGMYLDDDGNWVHEHVGGKVMLDFDTGFGGGSLNNIIDDYGTNLTEKPLFIRIGAGDAVAHIVTVSEEWSEIVNGDFVYEAMMADPLTFGGQHPVVLFKGFGEDRTAEMYFMADGTVFSQTMSNEWVKQFNAARDMGLDAGIFLADPETGWDLANAVDDSDDWASWSNARDAAGDEINEAIAGEIQHRIGSTLGEAGVAIYSDSDASAAGEDIAHWMTHHESIDHNFDTLQRDYSGASSYLSNRVDNWISENASDLGVEMGDSGWEARAQQSELPNFDSPGTGDGVFSQSVQDSMEAGIHTSMRGLGYEVSLDTSPLKIEMVVRDPAAGGGYDGTGTRIGNFSFELKDEGNELYLGYAQLNEDYQGKGVAGSLYLNLLPVIPETSVKLMSMNANITNGSYTWPDMGFLPTNGLDAIQSGITRNVNMGSGVWESVFAKDPKFKAAYETFMGASEPEALWEFIDASKGSRSERGWSYASEIMYGISFDASLDFGREDQASRLYAGLGMKYVKGPNGRYIPATPTSSTPRDADGDGIIYEGTDQERRIGAGQTVTASVRSAANEQGISPRELRNQAEADLGQNSVTDSELADWILSRSN